MSALTNTVLHADCTKAMKMLPDGSVNFVLTDPPYVARYQSRDGREVRNDNNFAWLKSAYAEMYRVLTLDSFCVSFYGWPHVDKFLAAFRNAGFRPVGHIMFPKSYVSSSRFVKYQHEAAYLLAKGEPRMPEAPISDVLPWQFTGNAYHPTQKPLAVLKPLIETFSAPGDIVLDPFAGSGSTLLAAKQLGRSYIGVERDAAYHAIARKRLAQHGTRTAA